MKIPLEEKTVKEIISTFGIKDFSRATIREVVAIAGQIEQKTGLEFIHMEMGVPGLPAAETGVRAEIKALQDGVASIYPLIDGLPELKQEAARFIKAFIDLDVKPEACVPVVGSMQGTFTSFLVCGQCDEKKDTILFIDPGFPVQKQQATVLGYKYESFDLFDFRGDKLKAKLEEYLSRGN
ncbi:MAG: aminotransferase class I/II-fold pyridoxal phosphate-dependent enzyme, partial [Candidatus Symbiothrix sp.]|nr:aminotransferase class I/II-fold pyridoxal phosphate-dependent enzyme [Candidatus Symbiothrix sp.]